MTGAAGPGVTSLLGTEFGRVLADLVGAVPGACGAVFSDREGYAVDYACDPSRMDGLELQIVGAQLGHPLARSHAVAVRHLIGRTSVLLESDRGALLGALVDAQEGSVLVLVLAPGASLGRALVRFDRARTAIATLCA